MSFLNLATDYDEDGPPPLTADSQNIGARSDHANWITHAEEYIMELIAGVTDENLHLQPENVRDMYLCVKKYGMPRYAFK